MLDNSGSGSSDFLDYLIHISANALLFSENYASIAVGMVQVLAIMISLNLIERTGRRRLMLLSSLGSCISLLALGLSLSIISSVKSNGINANEIPYNCSKDESQNTSAPFATELSVLANDWGNQDTLNGKIDSSQGSPTYMP